MATASAKDTAPSSTSQAPSGGGFSFNFEKTKEVPPARSYDGNAKYDWSQFPEPKKGADGKMEYTSALIEGASRKTLNTSINRYRDKLKEAGEQDREFTMRQVKDEKSGDVIGFRVYRVK